MRDPRGTTLAVVVAVLAVFVLAGNVAAGSTRLVRDIARGPTGSDPTWLTPYKGRLFFTAITPEHGEELWRSNGTKTGTRLVKDIAPGPVRRPCGVEGATWLIGEHLGWTGAIAGHDAPAALAWCH